MSPDGKIILAVNGEIYNHIKLRSSLKSPYKFKTHSDCEVIIPLVRLPQSASGMPPLLQLACSFLHARAHLATLIVPRN